MGVVIEQKQTGDERHRCFYTCL